MGPTDGRSAAWASTRSTSTSSTSPPGSAARRPPALTPSARRAAGARRGTAWTTTRTSTSPPSCAAARTERGGGVRHRANAAATPTSSARSPAEDGLQLEELLEPRLAPLPSVARLLVTAKAGVEVDLGAVQVHVAGSDALRDALGALEVPRRDVAREPVGGIVRDLHGLVVALVGQEGEDGAEDLLPGDRHVVAHVAEDGGLHVVPALEACGAARTTGRQLRPLVDPGLDEALDLVELRLAHYRAEHGAVAEGIADAHRLRGRLGDLERGVVLAP